MSAKKTTAKKTTANVSAFKKIDNALVARFNQHIEAGLENQAKEISSARKLFNEAIAQKCEEKQIDLNKVAEHIAAQKTDTANYICGKTVIKVIKTLRAIAQGIKARETFLDVTIAGLIKYGEHLTIKEMRMLLSRYIVDNGIDATRAVKQAHSYSEGTATSQASKVRFALAACGLATITRRAKGDTATLTEQGKLLLVPIFEIK